MLNAESLQLDCANEQMTGVVAVGSSGYLDTTYGRKKTVIRPKT